MTILSAVAGAYKPGASGLDDITANWGDIVVSGPTASPSNNANVTITFSSGGTRTLEVVHSGLGTFDYRINSGSYTNGTSFSVSTTNTVNFRYTDADINESFTVTVTDDTDGGRTIDTFDITVTGY